MLALEGAPGQEGAKSFLEKKLKNASARKKAPGAGTSSWGQPATASPSSRQAFARAGPPGRMGGAMGGAMAGFPPPRELSPPFGECPPRPRVRGP